VYFTLEQWPTIAKHAENMLPLRPRYTRDLLEEFRKVGRTTLLGTVATGLAQGALAGLGYFVTGVPEPAFFGAATALASLIPAVGTLFVWVPAGVFLFATGHPAMGALELAWGTLMVVGASDYLIRPALVGRHSTMPALLTFAALFGGVEAFGLIGLILGPLVMALSFSILRMFAHDAAKRA
jgi:predicted PurR-regulated permease PerM